MFRVGCRTCDPVAPHSTVHLPSCNSLFRPFATSGSGFLSEQTKQWKVSQESRVEKRWISQFGILEELFVF